MRVSDGEIRSGRVIFHATSRSGAKQRGAPKLDERWMERLVEEYRVEQMFIRGEIEDQDLNGRKVNDWPERNKPRGCNRTQVFDLNFKMWARAVLCNIGYCSYTSPGFRLRSMHVTRVTDGRIQNRNDNVAMARAP